MSILPHHKYLLRFPCYYLTTDSDPLSSKFRVRSMFNNLTDNKAKVGRSDYFIVDFKLNGFKCVRCMATTTTKTAGTGSPSSVVATAADRDLQSTWTHRAWVATGCTSVFVSLTKSAMAAAETSATMWFEPLLAGYLGYVLADLGSGVYHWAIDNYGDASTPMFGSQIEAFQGHHKWPWTITRRHFANNLHALARAVAFVVFPMDLASNDMVVHAFVGVCSGCIMFSQQFHAWAHGTKSRLPPFVVALQDAGLLVSRTQHAAHHRPPYNNNYCIVSGAWNEFLDRQRVFEALEMVLFFKFGLRPRSWSEPNPDWTEEREIPSLQIKPHVLEPQDLVCT